VQPVYDLKAKCLKASCRCSQALKISIESVGLQFFFLLLALAFVATEL